MMYLKGRDISYHPLLNEINKNKHFLKQNNIYDKSIQIFEFIIDNLYILCFKIIITKKQ